MKLHRSHVPGFINGVVSAAAGLGICAAIVPGATMSWRGFLIALVIIEGPELLFGAYVLAYGTSGNRQQLVGCAAGLIWPFVGPLVADWATPEFDIGGWWQYFVLLALIHGVAALLARAYKLGKRRRDEQATATNR